MRTGSRERTTSWRVERVVRFPEGGLEYGGGYAGLGFHEPDGSLLAVDYERDWAGRLEPDDSFAWTAGRLEPPRSRVHVDVPVVSPMCAVRAAGGYLVTSHMSAQIFRVLPEERRAEVFVEGRALGMVDVGNVVVDREGCVWANEVAGARIWRFDPSGEPVLRIGDGSFGFEPGDVPLEEARVSWVYDIRLGPDGCVYVLDSRNYAVRMVDLEKGVMRTIAGTGKPGYSGDGGDACEATLGSDPAARFDGPWSLSLDELGNVYIGDTQNRVVRRVDTAGRIATLAGDPRAQPGERNPDGVTDPRELRLAQICSMDYHGGRLFVPDLSGDLVVLARADG